MTKVAQVTASTMAARYLLMGQLLGLRKEGFDVRLICSPGEGISEITEKGIEVKEIAITRHISPVQDILSLIDMINYFKKEKIDIVHTHTIKPALLGHLAAWFAGTPVIINTVHGLYFRKNMPGILCWMYTNLEKFLAKLSTLVLVQSREDIKTMIERGICGKDKLEFLGNGIALENFDCSQYSQDFRKKKREELGFTPSDNIVGIVGRYVESKGFIDFFEACRMVVKKRDRVKFLVVALLDTERSNALSRDLVREYNLENRLVFLENRKDMPELYSIMDIFAFPSHREGFPRSCMEAAAMGIPTVASDISGCRQVIENGKTGILFPVKNREALARSILRLLEDPKTAERLGAAAREKAFMEFNEKDIIDRIIETYKHVGRG